MPDRSGAGDEILRPGTATLDAALSVKSRLGERKTAPVRRKFVERADLSEPTPLARVLRGGRGGEVRLKLELSFLWFAAKPPHELNYPARAWATLLGLPDPEGRGSRRIRDATNWLERNGFVIVEQRPGAPSVVTLLNEAGTGEPYELPGTAYQRLRAKPEKADAHRYIQIPDGFWTNGWVAVLSGAAVAMMLVLYTELGNSPAATTDLWFSPRQASMRYGLSEDTRSKGLRELRAAGVINARQRSASRDTFDFRRLRNTYRLNPSRLADLAEVPVTVAPSPPTDPLSAMLEDIALKK